MFRFALGDYAYCGHGPWSAHTGHCSRSRQDWRSGRLYAWHSGPTLGVRRPLRYLAFKLDLDEDQVRELAGILDDLKTARAQADLDWRRSISDLASAMEAAEFDADGARSALQRRAEGAEQLRSRTLACLERLHRLLDRDQRRELAYLMRSGGVSF